MPSVASSARFALGCHWLCQCLLILGFVSPLSAQEDRLVDLPPFDQLILDEANQSTVLNVEPLDLPDRKMPSQPQGVVSIRLIADPTRAFEVSWQNIRAVVFFEQILMEEAQRLTQEGNFDEAFDYYARLLREYPNVLGLNDDIDDEAAPARPVPGNRSVQALVDRSDRARVAAKAAGYFNALGVAAALLGLFATQMTPRWRKRWAACLLAFPASTMLIEFVPWWRGGVATGLALCVATSIGVGALASALFGRRPKLLVGAVSLGTALLLGLDASQTRTALAVAASQGASLSKAVAALARFPGIPGRMERIDCGQPYLVFVDIASTPAALENVLRALRSSVRQSGTARPRMP